MIEPAPNKRLVKNLVIDRILDANLDRAREGLRVIEEWCRFGLENAQLCQKCKDLRQELAQSHTDELRAARNTPTDPGTDLSHALEQSRQDIEAILRANLSRVQEALRVIEEYSKVDRSALSDMAKSMRYAVYTLESQLFDSAISGMRLSRLAKLANSKLYLITTPVPNLLEVVEACLKGGLSLVQYRQKEGNDQDRLKIAQSLSNLCHRYDALFLVNDRVDIAIAVGADGVHLGQTDLPVSVARSLLGQDAIIGLSTTSPIELAISLESHVDYVGVGPVFATPTKPGKAASGFEYVRYAAERLEMPWYAIGGIDADNLAGVMEAGASRVAVVRSLMSAVDPKVETENLLQQLS